MSGREQSRRARRIATVIVPIVLALLAWQATARRAPHTIVVARRRVLAH